MARTPYRAEIEAVASVHQLDPDLLEALVLQESGGMADAFRYEPGFFERYLAGNSAYDGAIPRRVSSSYGLTQIMYPTAQTLGYDGPPEMLFVPLVNLDYGARYLRKLLDRYEGDTRKALAAYNGGPGGVGRPLPQRYAERVLQWLDKVKGRST